ncbi:hypothetical protein MG293_019282 [Ovis ammon polii]|uniref:Uncharacterized protein n=1 Tax=Ovis ammon polii TaxID=230172 RepID=A0AAD4TMC2_OVIAM|nr:hypothetical protein MG293_019282 [Ovis ammon polii]
MGGAAAPPGDQVGPLRLQVEMPVWALAQLQPCGAGTGAYDARGASVPLRGEDSSMSPRLCLRSLHFSELCWEGPGDGQVLSAGFSGITGPPPKQTQTECCRSKTDPDKNRHRRENSERR